MADDLDRALSDAKKRAEGVAKGVKGAARDVYGQAQGGGGYGPCGRRSKSSPTLPS